MGSLNSENSPSPSETVWQLASQWIARTLAVSLIMVGPGLLGAMADKKLGTGFLSPLGFALGLVVGTIGLVVLAKRLTPPAAGKPLPFEGDDRDDNEQSEHPSPKD